jgi:hypothetical protein
VVIVEADRHLNFSNGPQNLHCGGCGMSKDLLDLPREIWKPVPGFEGAYEVSDHGRVRSLDRVVTYSKGGTRVLLGKALKTGKCRFGYPFVILHLNGNKQYYTVHRLVLSAFRGPCGEGFESCHNDGNPANNHIDNLRYDTRANNMADKISHGTHLIGEKHPMTVITEEDVISIRARRAAGEPLQPIAKDYGMRANSISAVCRGCSWRHVGGQITGSSRVLSAEQVLEIRTLRAAGETATSLALKYDVSQSNISKICRGEIWAHIGGQITKARPPITAEQKAELMTRCASDNRN